MAFNLAIESKEIKIDAGLTILTGLFEIIPSFFREKVNDLGNVFQSALEHRSLEQFGKVDKPGMELRAL